MSTLIIYAIFMILFILVLGALPGEDEKMQRVCRTILAILFGIPIVFVMAPYFVLIFAGIALLWVIFRGVRPFGFIGAISKRDVTFSEHVWRDLMRAS